MIGHSFKLIHLPKIYKIYKISYNHLKITFIIGLSQDNVKSQLLFVNRAPGSALHKLPITPLQCLWVYFRHKIKLLPIYYIIWHILTRVATPSLHPIMWIFLINQLFTSKTWSTYERSQVLYSEVPANYFQKFQDLYQEMDKPQNLAKHSLTQSTACPQISQKLIHFLSCPKGKRTVAI